MNSKTKRTVLQSDINRIFVFHNLGTVSEIKALSGGEFNSVYKVTADNMNYVIKIAPAADVRVLTYEKDIISSEIFALEHFKGNPYVHIPEVKAFGEDAEIGKYLIMEFVEGKMLLNCVLSDMEYDSILFHLGKAIAEFHNTNCDRGFGYLQNGLKQSWQEAYFSMLENIRQDAERVHIKIPYIRKIRAVVDNCKDVLDEVKKPSLLHFDLWKGNIFVRDKKLHSVIDCERMMLGDPVGDFIHLDYIAPFDKEKYKQMIDGYNSVAEHSLLFNKNERIRFYLVRLYLGLIAYVETDYRLSKYSVAFYGKKIFARKVLRVSLNELNKLMK